MYFSMFGLCALPLGIVFFWCVSAAKARGGCVENRLLLFSFHKREEIQS